MYTGRYNILRMYVYTAVPIKFYFGTATVRKLCITQLTTLASI